MYSCSSIFASLWIKSLGAVVVVVIYDCYDVMEKEKEAITDVGEEDVVLLELGVLQLLQQQVVVGLRRLDEHGRLQMSHRLVSLPELLDQIDLLLEDLGLRVHHADHSGRDRVQD